MSEMEMNQKDCDCEHIHASHPSCRSKAVSKGAVPESERIFPASPAPSDGV
jgi:hypothetical protein